MIRKCNIPPAVEEVYVHRLTQGPIGLSLSKGYGISTHIAILLPAMYMIKSTSEFLMRCICT